MHYVYVLRCADKSFYKGYSSNLKRRIQEHIKGQVSSTKNKLPVELIYYEAFTNVTDARREENYLKSGKEREQLKQKLLNT